jgi:predicted ATP pyrophosphatase (TIGR00289 family)
MKVAALCSGGKDSAYALWLALRQGHELVRIVAMIPAREDSWMFHYPNIHLIDFFAECVGSPLLKAETAGEKEQEVRDLKRTLRMPDIQGVVSGAIVSDYQKSRIDGVCQDLNLKHLAPLWKKEPEKLMWAMLSAGFEIIITSVSAQGFNESWLGRKLDEEALRDLIKLNQKYKINLSGEGGEYESLVLDAPFFRKRIEPVEVERIWRGDSGHLLVKKAELMDK